MTDDKTNPKPAVQTFVKRYYQVLRSEIGYLRFITESYDGLLFLRTLNNQTALIEVAYPPSRSKDAEALLAALAAEVGLKLVPAPETIPEL